MADITVQVLVKGVSFYEHKDKIDSATGEKEKIYQAELYMPDGNGVDIQAGLPDAKHGLLQMRDQVEKLKFQGAVVKLDLIKFNRNMFFKLKEIRPNGSIAAAPAAKA